MSLTSEGQSLSANQISSTYLDWWLRYNCFRFWKTNVRHIRNILSVSISNICLKSAHYSASGYRISSKSKHPLRKYNVISIFQDDRRDGWILLPVSYRCFQNVKIYQQTKFCWDVSNGGWDITASGFKIQTSAILEFHFWFRSWPVGRNMHVILHQATEFRPNRSTHCGNMMSYPFLKMAAATAKYYFRFCFCWCHYLQKVKVYQQTIFRRDIITSFSEKQTSAILEIYFRFRSRPVRRNLHVILHQATEFCPNWSTHCGNMTSYPFFKMAAGFVIVVETEKNDGLKARNFSLVVFACKPWCYSYVRGCVLAGVKQLYR